MYYSQLVEDRSLDFVGKCYQRNDPTSETQPDVLDTDGGVIPVNEASFIHKLVGFRDGVLIFSPNGVWFIRGTEGGFKATGFSVSRITGARSVSPESIVSLEDTVLFWGENGVFSIGFNEFDVVAAENITDPTIKTYYTDLTNAQKSSANGIYNRELARVEWYYKDPQGEFPSLNPALYLDLRTGGWFPQHLESGTEVAVGNVDYSMIAPLEVPSLLQARGARYLFVRQQQETPVRKMRYYFGERADESEVDKFYDDENFNINAHFIAGYDTLELPANKKGAPYIVTHMLRTEDLNDEFHSSLKMRGQWDWTVTDEEGRWTPYQEMYRFRRTYIKADLTDQQGSTSVVEHKAKMLGRGSALALRFQGKDDAESDFKLLGYTVQWLAKSTL